MIKYFYNLTKLRADTNQGRSAGTPASVGDQTAQKILPILAIITYNNMRHGIYTII
jgi:hypothetical protein